MEHPKLLIVDWVNALLAPVLGPLFEPFGMHASPEHPLIPAHIVMTMLIVAAITVFGFIVRARLSVENPGKLQILAEDGLNMMAGIVLPEACAATCIASINVQRMSVHAAIAGDIDLLKLAVLHDPLVDAELPERRCTQYPLRKRACGVRRDLYFLLHRCHRRYAATRFRP